MKDLWKYVSLFLALLFVGTLFVNFHSKTQLQNKIIELQEQAPIVVEKYVHDTIQFDSVQIKWRTKTKVDTVSSVDTLVHNDTIFINTTSVVQEEPVPFSFTTSHQDSTITANIYVEGKGVHEKTSIDSISLDYTIKQTVKKRKCNWWRRIFCGCD